MSSHGKPPTLSDVARLAGVSVPTASRVLNGGVRGSTAGTPELRWRVGEAARQLGYTVSAAAQATKDGRARTVALVVTDIDDYGSATMISGVMHAAEERGLSVAVRETRGDPSREIDTLRQLRGELHRAVLLATGRSTRPEHEASVDEELRTLQSRGASIVVIGDSVLDFPRVTVDSRAAARMLAASLVDAGLRRFAIIGGPDDDVTARDRLEGFVGGLNSRGIEVPERHVVAAEFSRAGGRAGVGALDPRAGDFDVIATMSDAMAVGAIRALHERGIVPGVDVEVTGFDHVPLLGDVLPDFSTVDVPLREFGPAALALALDHREGAPRTRSLHATPIVHGQVVEAKGAN